ncbi:hypothetical protein AAG906_037531 [Vitis piasezkii]
MSNFESSPPTLCPLLPVSISRDITQGCRDGCNFCCCVEWAGLSFLTGGKRSQSLLSAGVAAKAGAAVPAPRRLIVVAAAPKKSWLPGVKAGGNLVDPEWLDGSIPQVVQEAELIHGRWAMAAVVGIFVGQAWSGIPWFEAGAAPGAVAPFSFGTLLGTQLLLMGWVESKRWVDFFNPESQSVEWATRGRGRLRTLPTPPGSRATGRKFFDPLSLAGTIKDGVYIPDVEKLERLKLAEIKHARIAMLAMLIFYFEAGQGRHPWSSWLVNCCFFFSV